jgi:acyl CoA:acetate/3-ketoacid CoA transferase
VEEMDKRIFCEGKMGLREEALKIVRNKRLWVVP